MSWSKASPLPAPPLFKSTEGLIADRSLVWQHIQVLNMLTLRDLLNENTEMTLKNHHVTSKKILNPSGNYCNGTFSGVIFISLYVCCIPDVLTTTKDKPHNFKKKNRSHSLLSPKHPNAGQNALNCLGVQPKITPGNTFSSATSSNIMLPTFPWLPEGCCPYWEFCLGAKIDTGSSTSLRFPWKPGKCYLTLTWLKRNMDPNLRVINISASTCKNLTKPKHC